MSMTRKEFFRQGMLSIGKAAMELSSTLKGTENSGSDDPVDYNAPPPEPRPDMAAEAFNERCLARSCGCFACVERCDAEAIMVIPGTGIRIDGQRCSGCGMCEYVCPVTPKAIALVPRSRQDTRTETVAVTAAHEN